MRFKRLDLNLLPILESLLRTNSVSLSAKEMFITQSAMSNALARLRAHFQDPLLIQVGRHMQPSALANELKPELQALMLSVENIIERKADFDPSSSKRNFGIALSDYSMSTFIAPLMPNLIAQAPGLSFNFISLTEKPEDLLNRSDIHLVIAPEEICSVKHPFELIMNDEICCIVSQNNISPQAKFTKNDFDTSDHIVFHPSDDDDNFILNVCNEANLIVNVKVTTFSFESMCEIIKNTKLVGIIQKRLAILLTSYEDEIRIVEMPSHLPALKQMMQWHHSRSGDKALQWLRMQLVGAAKLDI